MLRKILSALGTLLVVFGGATLLLAALAPRPASFPTDALIESDKSILGWGTLILGFLTLASSHYFKLREARRADRDEARKVHDAQRSRDDVR